MDGKKRIARLRNAEKCLQKFKPIDIAGLEKERVERAKRILGKGPAVMPEVKKVVRVKVKAVGLDFPQRWIPIPKLQNKSEVDAKHTKFTQWLYKKGFQHLGSGCFSSVYAKPNSNRVIKVTRRLDNWIDYIQWAAKEGYAGGLAPRVYSWKRHDDWSVAVVERMQDSGYSGDIYKHDQALIMSLLYPAKAGNVMAKLYMEDLKPGAFDFFQKLSTAGLDGDINNSNIMYRSDGSLCITDPCAGKTKTTLKRLRSGELSPSLNLWRGTWKIAKQLSTV